MEWNFDFAHELAVEQKEACRNMAFSCKCRHRNGQPGTLWQRQRAFPLQLLNTYVILNLSMPHTASAMTDALKLNIDFSEQGRRA